MVPKHAKIREAINLTNLLLFGFFQFGLDPAPPPSLVLFFLNYIRNFFLNLILYKLKFLKVFGLWLSPKILLEKCPIKKKMFLIIFGIRQTPPLQKKFQTQAESFSTVLGSGKSSFISPGKRGANALFDVFQFVTPSRYPRAWKRKQKKLCRKNCFDNVVSDLYENGLNFDKITKKNYLNKCGLYWGKSWPLSTL